MLALALTAAGGEEEIDGLWDQLRQAPFPVLHFAVLGAKLDLGRLVPRVPDDLAAGLLLLHSLETPFLAWRTAYFDGKFAGEGNRDTSIPKLSAESRLDVRLQRIAVANLTRPLGDALMANLTDVALDDTVPEDDRIALLLVAHIYQRYSPSVQAELVRIAEEGRRTRIRAQALSLLSHPMADSLKTRLIVLAETERDPELLPAILGAIRLTDARPSPENLAALFVTSESDEARWAIARVAVSTSGDAEGAAIVEVLDYVIRQRASALLVEIVPRLQHQGLLESPTDRIEDAFRVCLGHGSVEEKIALLRAVAANVMGDLLPDAERLAEDEGAPEAAREVARAVAASLR